MFTPRCHVYLMKHFYAAPSLCSKGFSFSYLDFFLVFSPIISIPNLVCLRYYSVFTLRCHVYLMKHFYDAPSLRSEGFSFSYLDFSEVFANHKYSLVCLEYYYLFTLRCHLYLMKRYYAAPPLCSKGFSLSYFDFWGVFAILVTD